MAVGAVLGQSPDLHNLKPQVTISGELAYPLILERTDGNVGVNFTSQDTTRNLVLNTNGNFSLSGGLAISGSFSTTGNATLGGATNVQGTLSATGAITSNGIVTGLGLNANSQKVTNVATPTVNTDGVNKQYVDNQITALDNSLTQEITANSSGWQLIRTWGTGNVTVPSQYKYVKVELAAANAWVNSYYGYRGHDYKEYYYASFDIPNDTVWTFSASNNFTLYFIGEGIINQTSSGSETRGLMQATVGGYNSSSRVVNMTATYRTGFDFVDPVTLNYTYRIFGSP